MIGLRVPVAAMWRPGIPRVKAYFWHRGNKLAMSMGTSDHPKRLRNKVLSNACSDESTMHPSL